MPKIPVIAYSIVIFIIELALSFHAHHNYPGFLGVRKMLAFSLPLPIVVYCLLRGYFKTAALVFAAFSIFITIHVNPLYRGLSVVESNPLDQAIQQVSANHPNANWVADGLFIENFPFLNGAPSLSGVYYYPQPSIWKTIPQKDASTIYNRYAHVNFQLTTEGDPNGTSLSLLGIDHFAVNINVCSQFLQRNHVKYLLTTAVLNSPCITTERQIGMPGQTFYIYRRL